MAKATQYKFDTKPFFAVVGAGDIAVEKARGIVTDVQDKVTVQVNKVDRDPKVLFEELTKDAKEAQAKVEAQLKELQAELKALPAKLEAQLKDLQEELKALPAKIEAMYTESVTTFATRGEDVVAKLRGQEAAKPAAKPAPATKAPANKAPTPKAPATKAPANKAPANKAPANKATAKKDPA